METKTQESNECRCSQSGCSCAAVNATPCTCGESCACQPACRCEATCGCETAD